MRPTALAALTLLTLGACTHYDRYGDGGYDRPHRGGYGYHDEEWADRWGGDDLDRLDPWLEDTDEGREIVRRQLGPRPWGGVSVRDLNISFRRSADANRDMRLTDGEIRLALSRWADYGGR